MQIFVSYAHDDEYLVKTLIVDILEAASHRPWFDHHLVVGQDWKAQLTQQINQSDAFLYAVSPASLSSEWCKWEFKQAVAVHKPIIPVLLRRTDVPSELNRIQFVDFSKGVDGLSAARLLGGIQQLQIYQVLPVSDQPSGIPTIASRASSGDDIKYRLKVHLSVNKILADYAIKYTLEINEQIVWSSSILSFDGIIYDKEYTANKYRVLFKSQMQNKQAQMIVNLQSDLLLNITVNKSWLNGNETIRIT